MPRIQHMTEKKPNELLPGYHHVSTGGAYRSTLNDPLCRRKFREQMSKRQRRKHDKAVRAVVRENKE